MLRLLSLLPLLLWACAAELKQRPVSLDASNPDAPESRPHAASTSLAPEPAPPGPSPDEAAAPAHEHHHHAPAAAPAATYTCPMHPEVTSTTPDRCPKCGMNLVEKQPPRQQDEEPPPKHEHEHGHEGHH